MIYAHYFQDYDTIVEIDLNQELANGKSRTYLGSLFEPEDNQPPIKPDRPSGNESGIPGEDIRYTCKKTSDPDGDKLTYLFNWGDGTDSGWLPKSMATYVIAYHNWSRRGNYEVRVKAMDIYGRESEWSDPLKVTVPRTKTFINHPLLNLLSRFTNLFPIFRILLQRLG
jgi:hypothetical protein